MMKMLGRRSAANKMMVGEKMQLTVVEDKKGGNEKKLSAMSHSVRYIDARKLWMLFGSFGGLLIHIVGCS